MKFEARQSDDSLPRREILLSLFLVLATLAVYWPVQYFDFVNYDDPAYVTEVPQIKAGLSPAGLKWAFSNSGAFGGGLPVTSLSYLLDSQLFGINPSAFHLTNLGLHMASTLLVFFLLRRMTGADWRSALVAGLFALHPLCVEPVAWISSRKDVLSGFFFLLTLWFYARYADATIRNSQFVNRNYLLSLFFFSLGLLSKTMLVTLPFLLLLLDFWPLKRFDLSTFISQRSVFLRLVLEKLPFLALTILAAFMAYWNLNKGGAVTSTEDLSLGIRAGNALVSYLLYIVKTFWPHNLAVIYPYPAPWPVWSVAGAALILFAISVLALQSAQRHPYVLTGWFWFLGTLVPVIGVIQIGPHSMADRYTYLPLLGLFIILVWGIASLARPRPAINLMLKISAVGLFLICALCTRRQLQYWQNSESLLGHAVNVTRENYLAYNNLGAVLEESGKFDKAEKCFLMALEIKPDHVESLYNLALVLIKKGDPVRAQPFLERVLLYSPGHAGAHYNLANIFDDQGHAAESASHYAAALQIRPAYAEAHNNFAVLLLKQGRPDEAILQLRAALNADPGYVDALSNLGALLLDQGLLDEALPLLEKAADLALASNRKPMAEQIRARLQSYDAGKPFHR